MTAAIFGDFVVDGSDTGPGPDRTAVLLHASASSHRQWQALAARLAGPCRVIAPDLPGYGGTARRTGAALDGLAESAAMVRAQVSALPGPVDLVGHSWGAAVALEAAAALGPAVRRLVLFEPNLFGLIEGAPRAEAERLHARIRLAGLTGDWDAAAASFSEYFSGPGTWAGLPPPQRAAIVAALPANLGEWAAVTAPAIRIGRWQGLTAPVLLVSAADSRAALLAVADSLAGTFPHWQTLRLPRGGHMAPLTRARGFNDTVAAFLGA
jgi:pimeloyl-ACP methyl ester carboxylesterase